MLLLSVNVDHGEGLKKTSTFHQPAAGGRTRPVGRLTLTSSMLPTPRSPETFRFGDFELDVAAYELRCQGRPVQLERRPMDLLVLLVERRGQLVSRTDIVEQLWGQDVFVEVDPGVNTVIWKIRGALGDSSDHSTFVETVSGRGYRFVAPVEIVAQSAPHASPAPVAAFTHAPEPRRHNLPAERTSFVGRRKELRNCPGCSCHPGCCR